MSFGVDEPGLLSRTTSATVELRKKLNDKGEVLLLRTTGGMGEITTVEYTDDYTNEAVNGQTGTNVTSAHNYNEVNNDYAREEKTKAYALPVS